MTNEPNSGAPQLTSDERTWGMLAHLSGLVAAWFGLGVIGPVVVYFVKGQESQFIKEHSMEAINFNITVLIGIAVSFVLMFVIIGFFTLLAIGIAYLVLTIMAGLAANRGEAYRYPLTLRLVK